ncbi:hypothetical protein H8E88_03460 [candidate division KSB1 bacterium]|nr:hypothetical protein [candidate division KSB1 bacterium]
MLTIEGVARELNIEKNGLIKESLQTYLNHRLLKIETELFLLVKKYGIKDIFEFDSNIKKGFITEKEGYDDYFVFDNLEAERETLKKILARL